MLIRPIHIDILNTSPSAEELYGYKMLLDESANKTKPTLIPNSGKDHAALMYAKMFAETKSEVAMIVGDFCGEVSDNPIYLNALKELLNKRSINVRVLITDKPNPDSQALKLLTYYQMLTPQKVSIREGGEKTFGTIASRVNNDSKPVHWSVFDDDKFRLETATDTYSAIGGFHQPEHAKWLKEAFEDVFASGKDLLA